MTNTYKQKDSQCTAVASSLSKKKKKGKKKLHQLQDLQLGMVTLLIAVFVESIVLILDLKKEWSLYTCLSC